nr:hypothetical protein [Kibdelosporangium sp. MJ126-NF4]CTQ90829.1 hypothetical protein [Kibdelosporangium sp. MJ126-NF4]
MGRSVPTVSRMTSNRPRCHLSELDSDVSECADMLGAAL